MSGSSLVGLNRVSGLLCSNPLVDLGLTGNWQYMLDSTLVRAHSQAVGAKWGSARQALVNQVGAIRATPCRM
ncbi:hypothetical protein [Gluconobacter cerinus]|uniref:hypothetical protein n=1 Tax=Gluconobacter cerinus TaxID=38307 RepID=UPI003AB6FA4E